MTGDIFSDKVEVYNVKASIANVLGNCFSGFFRHWGYLCLYVSLDCLIDVFYSSIA